MWLAWILDLGAGFVLTLLAILWVRGTFRARYFYRFKNVPPADDPRFLRVLPGVSDSILAPGRVTAFYGSPAEIYRARLAAIAAARRSVNLETYYMVPGRRANELADALIAKAQEGVTVRFIADAQGVWFIRAPFWRRLSEGGVDVRFYNRLEGRAPAEYLSRTHRKLLVIDGQHAMVGGAGVSDEWDGSPRIGDTRPWADLEIRLEGPIVDDVGGTFMRQWASLGGVIDFDDDGATPAPEDGPVLVTTGQFASGVSPLGVLYQTCIAAARERLWLASPYFLPDTTTRRALAATAKRGVDVRILTMGRRNDRQMVYHASSELYGELLAAGVRVFEYQPSLMHAKALIVDRAWATVGSANFDPMSFFTNAELNVSAGQPALLRPLEAWLTAHMAEAVEITREAWCRRSWAAGLQGRFWLRFRRVL